MSKRRSNKASHQSFIVVAVVMAMISLVVVILAVVVAVALVISPGAELLLGSFRSTTSLLSLESLALTVISSFLILLPASGQAST